MEEGSLRGSAQLSGKKEGRKEGRKNGKRVRSVVWSAGCGVRGMIRGARVRIGQAGRQARELSQWTTVLTGVTGTVNAWR